MHGATIKIKKMGLKYLLPALSWFNESKAVFQYICTAKNID
jgi:hypothetical protein